MHTMHTIGSVNMHSIVYNYITYYNIIQLGGECVTAEQQRVILDLQLRQRLRQVRQALRVEVLQPPRGRVQYHLQDKITFNRISRHIRHISRYYIL